MSNLTKGLVLVVVILAIGVGLVVWKKKVGGHSSESFNSISREEVEMLLADVAKTNPAVLKRFTDEPDMKKQQLDNLKELLAFASQAQADGLAKEGTNRQELENIKAEITAVNYDRDINKDKGPMPPFGFITEDQVNAYWGQDGQPQASPGAFTSLMDKLGLGTPSDGRTHEMEFQDFLNAKVELLKAGNPEMKDREISDDEKKQARDIFAKIRIYYNEYNSKLAAGQIPKELADRVALQVKLQEAQFLARIYSEKIADKMKVTDEEVDQYIAAHPELNPEEKKKKATEILNRAKAGEDFAALANEFTTDPGNKDPKTGQPQGGLYKDVAKGKMMPAFEQGALALQEGQIAPDLIETDYGYHIIKLERKLGKKEGSDGETYDVRHILISTGFKDPDKPNAREMPIKDYVRGKLEAEKEKALIDDIVAKNNISVPTDFTVPEVTEEQMQQMKQKQMQQMQQMQPPPGADTDADQGKPGAKPAKPEPAKPEVKKK
ncbi:MAG: peptidylprolyl isomerase [Acidobacteriota bacterium]